MSTMPLTESKSVSDNARAELPVVRRQKTTGTKARVPRKREITTVDDESSQKQGLRTAFRAENPLKAVDFTADNDALSVCVYFQR